MNVPSDKALLLETCLMAGKIMTESGSEVYRVEDTMNRIAAHAGEADSISYVTATGLFMSLRSSHLTELETVTERSINLEKVVAVNTLSRRFSANELTLEELHQQLIQVEMDTPHFPYQLQVLAAGIISGTLMIVLGGAWSEFIPTFLVGGIGFITSSKLKKILLPIRFMNDFFAAFVIGMLAYLLTQLNIIENIDHVIIGSVMPLVPGVAITNAFRDILAGHLISGTARATEALFIAAAIGVGIAIVFKLFL